MFVVNAKNNHLAKLNGEAINWVRRGSSPATCSPAWPRILSWSWRSLKSRSWSTILSCRTWPTLQWISRPTWAPHRPGSDIADLDLLSASEVSIILDVPLCFEDLIWGCRRLAGLAIDDQQPGYAPHHHLGQVHGQSALANLSQVLLHSSPPPPPPPRSSLVRGRLVLIFIVQIFYLIFFNLHISS